MKAEHLKNPVGRSNSTKYSRVRQKKKLTPSPVVYFQVFLQIIWPSIHTYYLSDKYTENTQSSVQVRVKELGDNEGTKT